MDIVLQPKQQIAFTTDATEVLYGGAVGGGKSVLLRASAIRWCLEVPGIQVYLFRRTLRDLRDNHLRGPMSFFYMLGELMKSGHVKYKSVENEFVFWNGSYLHLCYCDSENDVENYRGSEMHVLCCEENERIRMADGGLKAVSAVMVGDMVETLQGPRRVTWVGDRKLKPCVSASVNGVSQIHSTTHKVLTPYGWFSYDDIACASPLSLTSESKQSRSSCKYESLSASEFHTPSRFHGIPLTDQPHTDEFQGLLSGGQSWPESAACIAEQSQESGSEASLCGNGVSQQPFSGFSFPVVLCEQNPPLSEDASLRKFPLDATPYVRSECMGEDFLFGYLPYPRSGGEYQRGHSNKSRGNVHKQADADQHNPKNSPLDGLDTVHEHTPYKSLRYCHPYIGEERISAKEVRLDTCFVAPCGDKWTIDLTVDGENHYITESGFVNQNCMDELTHFSNFQYRFLRGRVRMAGLSVPEQYQKRLPRIECGSNPGSIGHAWVKQTFVSPKPELEIWETPPDEGGMIRQFIPAKLSDNLHLMRDDPKYADRVRGLGGDHLVRAMLDGDWDIVAGQAFEKLRRDVHGLEPFTPPADWQIFGSLDWGSSRPFSFGLWCVANGDELPNGVTPQRGAIIRFDEWYGWSGKQNEGLRLEVAEVADGIKAKLNGRRPAYIVADPSMWKVDGGPSHAETFMSHGVILRRADNSRITGYQALRDRIAGDEDGPMMYATTNCHAGFWRTMPNIVMDARHVEDVDTSQEDHAYDDTRYAAMSRPWVRIAEKKEEKPDRWMRAFEREDIAANDWKTI